MTVQGQLPEHAGWPGSESVPVFRRAAKPNLSRTVSNAGSVLATELPNSRAWLRGTVTAGPILAKPYRV
eukprot:764562-Hanusia_phi.AAC.2